MIFRVAPYDRIAKSVTSLVFVVLLAVALVPHVPLFVVVPLDVLILLVCYAYSPRKYAVSRECITVSRLAGSVRIPLAGLREARAAAPDDFRGCIRLWGNGGMFGYYGLFRTSKLGKCTWYVTDRSKAVVVITQDKTALFSPDDATGFLTAVGAPAASAPAIPPIEAGGISARVVVGVVGTLVGLAGVAFGVLATVYSPGPPSYTLTRDSLTIHDRFYPVTLKTDAIDAGEIRVVDVTEEPDWRTTARTDGFANAHYQSGFFRVAGGKTVEMYRAGGRQLVLLPGKPGATTVLYQAQDPEKFAAEIRHEWLR